MLTLWCWLIQKGKKTIQSVLSFPASRLQLNTKNILDKLVEVFKSFISDPISLIGVSTFKTAFGRFFSELFLVVSL